MDFKDLTNTSGKSRTLSVDRMNDGMKMISKQIDRSRIHNRIKLSGDDQSSRGKNEIYHGFQAIIDTPKGNAASWFRLLIIPMQAETILQVNFRVNSR